MLVDSSIQKLIQYSLFKKYLAPEDKYYYINDLISLLNITEFKEKKNLKKITTISEVRKNIKNLCDYSLDNKITSPDNVHIFESKIYSCLIGTPSYINSSFFSFKPSRAFAWLHDLNIFSKYIDTEKISKNIHFVWKNKLNISINTVKPEIKSNRKVVKRAYPKTYISSDNVGYLGGENYNLRKVHRIIPLQLNNESWYFQFSPYSYVKNHGILFTKNIAPMNNDKNLLKAIIDFNIQYPFISVFSNSDKLGTGASILEHKHVQTSTEESPLEKRKTHQIFKINDVSVQKVDWYISSLKLVSDKKKNIIDLGDKIISLWKKFKSKNLVNDNNNTVSIITKIKSGKYIIYIIFRNNSLSADGVNREYDIPAHLKAIKSEGIGVIEAVGNAILPGRLLHEIKMTSSKLNNDWKRWHEWVDKHYKNNSKKIDSNYLIGKSFEEILKNINPFKNNIIIEKTFFALLKKNLSK